MNHEERLAHNEATFRDANEEIHSALVQHQFDAELAPFICECSDSACRQIIRIPLGAYRDVRAVPTRFVIAADHEQRSGQGTEVIERHDEFLVVEKRGDAGEVAEERAS